MMYATEINELTTRAKIEKEEIKNRKALRFIEKELMPTIKALAKQGSRNILVQKPKKIKWKYVNAHLEQHSFQTVNFFNYCWIHW